MKIQGGSLAIIKLYIKKDKPDPEHANRWISVLEDRQMWRMAKDYWEFLGSDVVEKMGYSYQETKEIIDKYEKTNQVTIINYTLPLKWLLKPREERSKWEYELDLIIFLRSIQRIGLLGTLSKIMKKVIFQKKSSTT